MTNERTQLRCACARRVKNNSVYKSMQSISRLQFIHFNLMRLKPRRHMMNIIAGVCLLALSLRFTDALEMKQNEIDCMNLAKKVLECLTALLSSGDHNAVCTDGDTPILKTYLELGTRHFLHCLHCPHCHCTVDQMPGLRRLRRHH